MRLLIPAAFACVLLAACQVAETNGSDAPQREQTANTGAQAALFFVGDWAVSEEACGTIPWEFTETGLSTPGEVSCTFDEVNVIPEGYEIAATCTAEGPPSPYRLKLARAQSADALLVEGGPFTPIGLVSCEEG